MFRNCTHCTAPFEVTDDDLRFYERVSPSIAGKTYQIPPPTLCPLCRQQRRLAFRNEKTLHHRKCDKTGRQIISMYSPDKPFPVYDQDVWWSDQWDPLEYSRDFDFSRSFFEQFRELQQVVPRISLNAIQNKNSYYTNYAFRNKDCYLIYTADENEDCYYGRFSDRNKSCTDFDFTYDSAFCYETIDIHKCNQCFFSQKCTECSDVYFCYDLRNCHNCIFCGNLRGKKYHVFNKPVSREEFQKIKADFTSWKILKMTYEKANEFFRTLPHKNLENVNCEDCLGDYLQNSKNAHFCFDGYDLFDVKFATHLYKAKDCYDWDFVGMNSELCYEMCSSAHRQHHCAFSMHCWDGNNNLLYCDLCLGSKNCFGCIGLRKKEYCILNKQYSKKEYEKLVPKIIGHLQNIPLQGQDPSIRSAHSHSSLSLRAQPSESKTGSQQSCEWGEFFPMTLAPICYNESVAQEYFPLTQKETTERNLKWHEEEKDRKNYLGPEIEVSDRIEDVDEKICEQILFCEFTKKPYKIIPQELKFYKSTGIPIPRVCPEERHRARRNRRNKRTLHGSHCRKCGTTIQTSYGPERGMQVCCAQCYLQTVD